MSSDSVKPAAPAAPAIMRTGLDTHAARFLPRKAMENHRDVLYHGKPQLNYKGIPYRQPKRIERLHAGDRLAVHGKQPVPDWMLVALAQDYHARTGNFPPKTCRYPAPHKGTFCRGLTVPGVGLIMFDLVGDGQGTEAYLE